MGRGPWTDADLEATLLAIVERLGKRLRAAGRRCRTVVLRLRLDDFGRATRSRSLAYSTDRTDLILTLARGLFADALPLIHERGCTLVGLSLTNLDGNDRAQPVLPFEPDHGVDLDAAMDSLRDRFGRDALTRAVLVGRHHGEDVPMLPD
jgi:DNA polymerase-4